MWPRSRSVQRMLLVVGGRGRTVSHSRRNPMLSTFVAFTIVFSSSANDARAAPPALNEDLRKELLQMMKVDQDMRTEFIAWTKRAGLTASDALKKSKAPELKKFEEVDRKNTARMKEIVDRHGWPGKSLAGKDGANAAWLLVQHADKDPEFQKKCLGLMKQLGKGEVSGQHLAYLTDRVLVGEKKKQVY